MHRLTLILSDLYLPDPVAGDSGLPQTHELGALQWLLRFAARRQRIADWRSWLVGRSIDPADSRSLAAICAQGRVPEALVKGSAIATPVHLEARLDHVRLADKGLLRLQAGESDAWCEEFRNLFGRVHALHPCGDRAFVLTGLEDPAGPVADPARLLGAEIGPALPRREARDLRRLWAEMELWLHASPLNERRERAGQARISALWIWGREPVGGSSVADPLPIAEVEFRGQDPLILSLASLAGNEPGLPPGFAQFQPSRRHTVVQFAALTGGAEESLPALEAQWFGPARDALRSGNLESLALVANDRVFEVTPGGAWKFWRRRRHWLEALKA